MSFVERNNYLNNVVIEGDNRDDVIRNYGSRVNITAYSGADVIYNNAEYATINAGYGNDTVVNDTLGSNSVIYGNDGADVIHNNAEYTTINAGNGDDVIINDISGNNNLIYGISGSNAIINGGLNTTIIGGWDDDEILSTRMGTVIEDKFGNNIISIKGGLSLINTGSGNDTIAVGEQSPFVTVNAGAGNDAIASFSNKTEINGGSGADTIIAGSDYMYSFIDGGADNDFIGANDSSTIIGGTGDDTISLKNNNHLIRYANGDGNDIIQNYGSNDTIQIAAVSNLISTVKSGNDIIVKVGNGSMKLEDAANESLNLVNAYREKITLISNETDNKKYNYDTYISNDKDNAVINAGESNDEINNFGYRSIINAGAGNDSIWTENYSTIIGGTGNDTIQIYFYDVIKYTAGDGNDIILGYNDTNTIQIAQSSYTTQVNGDDIIVKVGNGSMTLKNAKDEKLNIISEQSADKSSSNTETIKSEYSYNASKTILKLNKNFNGTLDNYESKVKTIDGTSLTSSANIIGNIKPNTIKGGIGADTINGGGGNDNLTGGAGADVFVYNEGEGNDIITDYTEGEDKIRINGRVTATKLSGKNIIMSVGSGKITIKNGKGKEITVIDEEGNETSREYQNEMYLNDEAGRNLTAISTMQMIDMRQRTTDIKLKANAKDNTIYGGSGNDTIITGGGKDVFVYQGGNDVITDYAATDKLYLEYNEAELEGKDIIFKTNEGKVTLKESQGKIITLVDGEGNETKYVDETISRELTNENVKKYTAAANIVKFDMRNRTEDIQLTANAKANTIIGGYGNDTIATGGGKDVFVYKGGNDIITDYSEANDKIQIEAYDEAELEGKNIVFKMENGSLTVKNGKGKVITLVNGNGEETKYVDSSVSQELDDASNKNFVMSNKMIKVDASNRIEDIKIVGNAKANTIIGGYGNDTIATGSGKDVFVYNGGNDIITDYSTNDNIAIASGAVDAVKVEDKNVIFEIGAGSLTVKNGKGKQITLTDGEGNTTSQKYNESVIINEASGYVAGVADTWFTATDNTALEIETIMPVKETKYSVGKIDTTNALTQSLNTLTYNKDSSSVKK